MFQRCIIEHDAPLSLLPKLVMRVMCFCDSVRTYYIHHIEKGTYMSMIKRDTKKSTSVGKSPTFQIRISPDLREQLDEVVATEGVSLGNWFKELARKELRKKGIEPKG
ncbi:toxin-antitoxin system HicB family antitoxin [Pectobacterium brasiliense]|nr:toxin-antitoxin system HicB family antitoxin [Pectobacterium brasiliense]